MKKVTELATRPPMFRFAEIAEIIEEGKYPSSHDIAARLEVSVTTIKRDLEAMQNRLKFPLEYDKRRHGWFFTEPPSKMFGLGVTLNVLRSLTAAYKALLPYQGVPFAGQLLGTLAKLTEDTEQTNVNKRKLNTFAAAISFFPFGVEKVDPAIAELIEEAMEQRRGLRFHYREAGVLQEYEFAGHPYHVTCINQRWHLDIFVPAEKKIRSFAVCRMRGITHTGETYQVPEDYDPTVLRQGAFLTRTGTGNHKIVLDLDIFGADSVRGRELPGNGEFIEKPGGHAQVRMWLSTLDEIQYWVGILGTHLRVLEPRELAERVSKIHHVQAAWYDEYLGEGINRGCNAVAEAVAGK
jgi:predicted DNA-binding transcriptional regulator YafY